MTDILSIFSAENRNRLLLFAGALIVAIAAVDWLTKPYISIGFLYLFPIMIAGGYLLRWQIVAVSVCCAVLQEVFSELPAKDAIPRLILTSAGIIGTGLFVSELIRKRRLVESMVRDVQAQAELRREAEEQLRVLVESSPAAIVTIGPDANIVLANFAAQQLFTPDDGRLKGQPIASYLPSLQRVVQAQSSTVFRTALQCKGRRGNGEVFMAGVWFSRYMTGSGPRVAAIVVDVSEDMRNREELSLNHLLKNSRILMSAVSHEVRNLCGAALAVHDNLSRVKELQGNEDFQALGTLVAGLEKISALELRSADGDSRSVVEVESVLDELRVLIESDCQEAGIEVRWNVEEHLPLVWADRYGLIQVFLNLIKNSRRALQSCDVKKLVVRASVSNGIVVIRVEDSGTGIRNPADLFRPFQRGAESSGLGLYVSRAILKSFGAEIAHEARAQGCCFTLTLQAVAGAEAVEYA